MLEHDRHDKMQASLHHSSYLNWALIATVGLIITVCALVVVPPLVSSNLAGLWLFSKTQMLTVSMLTLMLVALAGLAHQHRYLRALRSQFEKVQREDRERTQKHAARVYALLNVSRMMVQQNDLQSVFDCITRICSEVFSCDKASLMLHDGETGELVVRSVSGGNIPAGLLDARVKVGEGIAGWVAKHREPLLLHDDTPPDPSTGLVLSNEGTSAAMVVPVILRDELVGVVNVSGDAEETRYDEDDLRALQVFAENVGTCIRHTEQAEWMRATIRRLQSKAETAAHAPETR